MKKFFSILFFFSLISLSEENVTALNLSLKDTIKLALEHSEDLKIKEKNIDRTHQQYIEARSGAFPKIRGELGVNRYFKIPGMPVLNVDPGSGTITGSTIVPLKQDWEMKIGATLEQPIWTFGKVGGAIKLAREAKDAEYLAKEIQKREIEFNARVKYATVLFFQRIYQISKDSYENAQKNKTALHKRFGFGRVSRYDNLKISADVAARLPQVINAKNNFVQAEKDLKVFVGSDENIKLNLTDKLQENFENLFKKELVSSMLENEPNLKALKKNINLNSLIASIYKSDHYPTIAGFISYDYSGNSSSFPVEKDAFSTTAVAGVVLRAKIFDAGATSGKHRQAIENKGISELTHAKTLKALNLELETSFSEYNFLKEILEANVKALALARASYETSLSHFSTGGVTLTQLNDAELMLSGAKFNMENTIYSLNILLSKIYRISALPLGDKL